jgi:hypothetical protein
MATTRNRHRDQCAPRVLPVIAGAIYAGNDYGNGDGPGVSIVHEIDGDKLEVTNLVGLGGNPDRRRINRWQLDAWAVCLVALPAQSNSLPVHRLKASRDVKERWKDGDVGTVRDVRVRTWQSQIDGDWRVMVNGHMMTAGEARTLAEHIKTAAHICETDGDPEAAQAVSNA